MQNVVALGDIFCSLIAFETKRERVMAYNSQWGFLVKIIKTFFALKAPANKVLHFLKI